jgi:5-methylcytosine-specific restriction protein A
MPKKALKPCAHVGCFVLTNTQFCPTHEQQHRLEHSRRCREVRPASEKLYHTTRWAKLRRFHLSQYPLCVMCSTRGFVAVANVVDHIIPIVDGGAMFDPKNLQSLCRPCHTEKTTNDNVLRKLGIFNRKEV